MTLHHLNLKKVLIKSLLFDESFSEQEIQNFVADTKKVMKHPLLTTIIELPYSKYKSNYPLNPSFKYDIFGYK